MYVKGKSFGKRKKVRRRRSSDGVYAMKTMDKKDED